MRLTCDQLLQLSSGQVVDLAEGELPAQLQELLASQARSSGSGGVDSAAVEAAVAAVAAAKSRAAREAAWHGAAAGEAADRPAAPQPPGGGQGGPSFLLDSMLGRLCRWLRCLVSRMLPAPSRCACVACVAHPHR
jgi:hypothetical protein